MKNKIMLLLMLLGLLMPLTSCKKEVVKTNIEQSGLSGYYKIIFSYNHTIQNNGVNPNSPVSGNVIITQTYTMGSQAICYFKGEKGQYIKFMGQQILGASSHKIGYELYETTPTGDIKSLIKNACCIDGYVYVYLD